MVYGEVFGYILLLLACSATTCNLYFAYIRPFFDGLRGLPSRHDSGVSILGTILLALSLALLNTTWALCLVAAILLLLDPGGALWLAIMCLWWGRKPRLDKKPDDPIPTDGP